MSIIPPEPLQIAMELGLCRYLHITVQVTIPPATGGIPTCYRNLTADEFAGVKVDALAINRWRIDIAPPPKTHVWRTFQLVFGQLHPAGTSTDVVITHNQTYMVEHEDPWLHSLADKGYPHSLTLTNSTPETMIFENNTLVAQTLDLTIHLMAFRTKDDWDDYQDLLKNYITRRD